MSLPPPPQKAPTRGFSNASTGGPGSTDGPNTRVDIIDTEGGRILCVADVRGQISMLNDLAVEHNAKAIIHSGDFGFYEPSSLERISERTLRHLIQYSNLLPASYRTVLLNSNPTTSLPGNDLKALLSHPPPQYNFKSSFPLSEFPLLLSGELKLKVPTYTVWGACEDVAILEKIRMAPSPSNSLSPNFNNTAPHSPQINSSSLSAYAIPNLTVLDEATTRCLLVGGVKLRLFGLGGAVVGHKLFDNGEGAATIAGGAGTMWTTVLQIGELIDTAQRVYDPQETRLLITHASPGREGLICQLALALKADLTISAGLHFRYGVSYNEFSVQHDQDTFRTKLENAKKSFSEVWETVKGQVEVVVDENQKVYLQNALAVTNRVPPPANTPGVGGASAGEEPAWKNTWNWNLPDAAFGSLILDIKDGRIGSEMKSQGFNFAYRTANRQPQPQSVGQPSTNNVPPQGISQTQQQIATPPNQGQSANVKPPTIVTPDPTNNNKGGQVSSGTKLTLSPALSSQTPARVTSPVSPPIKPAASPAPTNHTSPVTRGRGRGGNRTGSWGRGSAASASGNESRGGQKRGSLAESELTLSVSGSEAIESPVTNLASPVGNLTSPAEGSSELPSANNSVGVTESGNEGGGNGGGSGRGRGKGGKWRGERGIYRPRGRGGRGRGGENGTPNPA